MLEVKHGETFNITLLAEFATLNYQPYRLIPGLNLLVPLDPDETLDIFQLNIMLCKKDRAEQLASDGLLVLQQPVTKKLASPLYPVVWPDSLLQIAYLKSCRSLWQQPLSREEIPYASSLAGYFRAYSSDTPTQERVELLQQSYQSLVELVAKAPTFTKLSTLVRISIELGKRQVAVQYLQRLVAVIKQNQEAFVISEPFLPASARFDTIPPGEQNLDWWRANILEALELYSNFSGYYNSGKSLNLLRFLIQNPFHSSEIRRRLQLVSFRGKR
jgi:hypothetical protein